MKKIPPGAEASNVLIGEVDFLQQHVSAFLRLKNSVILGDLTEVTQQANDSIRLIEANGSLNDFKILQVPVPTRFLFVLLGPKGHGAQFREIGRAVATLMSDEVCSKMK